MRRPPPLFQFGIDTGPLARNKRVLTMFHKNVTKEHWQSEIRVWAVQYPLGGARSTTAASWTTGPAAAAAEDGATPAARAVTVTGTGPTAAPNLAGSSSSGTASPTFTSLSPDHRRRRSGWVESRTLRLLRFFQRRAFCCGVEGPRDYAALGAQMPLSCVCRDDGHQYGQQVRPPCTAQAHTLANGTVSAVWQTGCLQVKRELMTNLGYLCNLMMATVALQAAVMALGLVLGLNMPSSLSDDSDDEGDDY